MNWVKQILIPETNTSLERGVNYGEFILFLVIWLKIATEFGYDRFGFWSKSKIYFRDAILKLNYIILSMSFDNILKALKYTNA